LFPFPLATRVGVTSSRISEFTLTFYQRLCQAGKAKKLALTACMRKLLTILNAMAKSGTLWRHDANPVGAEA
jgi:transposase